MADSAQNKDSLPFHRSIRGALNSIRVVSHLHDVDGIGDHRAPGHGDVEWGYIAAGLPPSALRVFEINQHQPADAVAGAIPFLRERGVV